MNSLDIPASLKHTLMFYSYNLCLIIYKVHLRLVMLIIVLL